MDLEKFTSLTYNHPKFPDLVTLIIEIYGGLLNIIKTSYLLYPEHYIQFLEFRSEILYM